MNDALTTRELNDELREIYQDMTDPQKQDERAMKEQVKRHAARLRTRYGL
jgi:hypothetical protein